MIHSRIDIPQEQHTIKGAGMITDPSLIALLEKLAAEDNISVQELIAKLVKHEDERRHSAWSRSKTRFVRFKCGKDNCFETNKRPDRDDIAD